MAFFAIVGIVSTIYCIRYLESKENKKIIVIVYLIFIATVILSFSTFILSSIHDSNPSMPIGTLFIGFYYIL